MTSGAVLVLQWMMRRHLDYLHVVWLPYCTIAPRNINQAILLVTGGDIKTRHARLGVRGSLGANSLPCRSIG